MSAFETVISCSVSPGTQAHFYFLGKAGRAHSKVELHSVLPYSALKASLGVLSQLVRFVGGPCAGWNLAYFPAGDFSTAPNPKTFMPDRYLDAEGRFVDSTSDATAFEVFGGGARMCIGYKFAKDELLVFLMCFLKGYDLEIKSSKPKSLPFRSYSIEGRFLKRTCL